MCGWSRRLEEAARPLVALNAEEVLIGGYVQFDGHPREDTRPLAARSGPRGLCLGLPGDRRPGLLRVRHGQVGRLSKGETQGLRGDASDRRSQQLRRDYRKARGSPSPVLVACQALLRESREKRREGGGGARPGDRRAVRLGRICCNRTMDTKRRQRLRKRISIPRAERLFESPRLWREGCPCERPPWAGPSTTCSPAGTA